MANTVLQSIGRLNQFLGQERAIKRVEDKEALVNATGSQMAKKFASLGPDATVEDIGQLTMEAMSFAGKHGVLKESLPTLGLLSQQAAALGKYRDLVNVAEVTNRAIPGVYGNELEGIEKPLVRAQAYEALRSREYSENVVEGGQTIHRIFNTDRDTGQSEVIRETVIGPSPGALAQQKARIKMAEREHEYGLKGQLEQLKKGLGAKAYGGGAYNQKVSELGQRKKLLLGSFSDISNKIINQSNLTDERKAEIKKYYPGGVDAFIENALKDPKQIQEIFGDVEYDVIGGYEPDSGTFLVGLQAEGFKGVGSEHGTLTDILVPQGMSGEFMEWTKTREIIQGVEKQIQDISIDPTKSIENRRNQAAEDAAVNIGVQDIEMMINDKQKYPKASRILEGKIRKLANDQMNPIDVVWKNLTDIEKGQFSRQLLIEKQVYDKNTR